MEEIRYRTGHLLVQIGNAVTWFRNRNMQEIGLTSGQSGILFYIHRHSGERITAGDIMSEFSLSKATVSEMVHIMEKKMLLTRHTDDTDARKSILVPTQKSLELAGYLQEVAARTEKILLKGMTEEEQEQLNRLLQTALKNMKDVRDGESEKNGTPY